MTRSTLARLFRPETAFFVLVLLGTMLAYRERGFYDPGALWHVKVGELILERGFPHTDPFTYTFAEHIWIPQQWGAEVLMALAHRVGGFDTMLLGFAVLMATLYTLIFRRCLQSGMGPILAGIVVGGCLFVGAFHYFVRPHMFTIALLGWTMMCIVDFERGRCGVGRLALLIPLYIVWTNLHGGVLGGTMTLGLAVGGWGVLFLANGRRKPAGAAATGENHTYEATPSSSAARKPAGAAATGENNQPAYTGRSPIQSWRTAFLLVGIVIACGLTPFVNPFGMEMLNTWKRIVGSKVLPELVNEHMPLDPASPLGLAVIGFGVVYLFMLAGTIGRQGDKETRRQGETATDPGSVSPSFLPRVSWLVPLAWFVLSFKGIRQGPLFAITGAVAIADMWPHTIWHRILKQHSDGTLVRDPDPADGKGWACAAIPACVVLLVFGLQVKHVEVPVIGHGWARLDPAFIPVELNDKVKEYAASVPPGTRVFNDANLGGYLIYHAPTLKIFMDDRCELYGDAWIRNYADTLALPPDRLGPLFEELADGWKFDRAFVMTNPPGQDTPPLEQYLTSATGKWKEVARAQRAVVFERVK